jgi:hypothetical protein
VQEPGPGPGPAPVQEPEPQPVPSKQTTDSQPEPVSQSTTTTSSSSQPKNNLSLAQMQQSVQANANYSKNKFSDSNIKKILTDADKYYVMFHPPSPNDDNNRSPDTDILWNPKTYQKMDDNDYKDYRDGII